MTDPSPATVASSLAAHVRVFATCSHCHHDCELDLAALAAAGHGATALLALPLRCEQCGRRGHGVVVDGHASSRPLGRDRRQAQTALNARCGSGR